MSGTDRTQWVRLSEVNLADAEGNLGNYAAQQELLEKALAIKDRSSLCISVAGVGNSVRSMQGTLGTILLLSGDWGVVRARHLGPATLPGPRPRPLCLRSTLTPASLSQRRVS